MSMPIKACGGAEFFRGACRDRYLGRRDCADCEPLSPAPQGESHPVSDETVAAETSGDGASGDETSADSDEEPARPRAPRGAKKRP